MPFVGAVNYQAIMQIGQSLDKELRSTSLGVSFSNTLSSIYKLQTHA